MNAHMKAKQSNRKETSYQSTFDGEIIRLGNGNTKQDRSKAQGGPRQSHRPAPVLPGSRTLSDAIENGRRRREAQLAKEVSEREELLEETAEEKETGRAVRSGQPLMIAVEPGSFQRRIRNSG